MDVLRATELLTRYAIMDGIQSVPEYAHMPGKFHQYTMRSLFERYRDGNGARSVDAGCPEMNVTEETREISCMVCVRRTVGNPVERTYVGPLPATHNDIAELEQAVFTWVSGSVDSGYF